MRCKTWLKEIEERERKQKIKDKINTIITITICLIILVVLCIINYNDTKKAVDECVRSGNTYNYCMEKLG